MNYFRKTAIMAVAISTVTLSSCHQNRTSSSSKEKAELRMEELCDSLTTLAWERKDGRVLPTVDSLEASGVLTSARADFIRGISYDRMRHVKVGEQYYAKVYETADPEKEGWDFYMNAASRLSQLRMTMSDYKGSIAVATDMLERAKKAGKLNDGWKIGYLWSIAVCQMQLGLDECEQTNQEVYDLIQKRVQETGSRNSIINLLVFTNIIAHHKMGQNDYVEAEKWLKKDEEVLTRLKDPGDSAVIREYKSKLALSRVDLLEGQGKSDQAYAYFRKSLPVIVASYECVSDAARYLLNKGKYDEAADLYNNIDKTTPEDNKESEMNLENIGGHLIPRLKANLGAGRKDSVVSIARRLADHYGPALASDRENNAAELATIYDTQGKEMKIAEQRATMNKQRSIAMMCILLLVVVFFIIYTWYRRRAAKRLAATLVQLQEAHSDLQEAYKQLETTTAAKERIESELRIARDIQMSMVPGVFPEQDNLDMYAEMTPAKEVGGDLYGYVKQGDSLYFCVGDVSGKGVPASLFMAQVARLFRTLATEGMMPADIATRMNNELSEGNNSNMFVTMFIGLLHLDTGRLDFCNCGHNPPVLDGQFLEMQDVNQVIGFWEDSTFYGESIDDIRGHQLLLYTDGLNEAENTKYELFGDDRILELMADSKALTSHQVIDKLKEAVEQHRAGAEPNDDLTLMYLKLT